ncbi:hypothetical protein ACWGRN_29935 [Streptomyces albidoflavus]
MASTSTAIVAGTVLKVDRRKGTSQAGNAYDFHTVRVLVADAGLAEVSLADNIPVPSRGDDVSYVAEFSVYKGDVQGKALELVA